MKKFSIIFAFTIIFSVFFQVTAFSSLTPVPNSCSSEAYLISNPVSRGLQEITGIIFFTTKIAELIIKNQISKLVQKGRVSVHLKTYSAGDLISGKIKGFEITGKNVVYNNIYLSSVKAKSLCDFTYFDYQKKPAILNSPLFISYSAEISNNSLQKIFSSDTMKEALQGIKINVSNISLGEVDFTDIKPSIINQKINIKANLVYKKSPFIVTFPINLETSLKIKNDKIFLSNLKFKSNSEDYDLKFVTNSIELNNINIFDLKAVEKENSDINIKKIKIINDKIFIEGTFWQQQDTTL
jgi:hypothetical protein